MKKSQDQQRGLTLSDFGLLSDFVIRVSDLLSGFPFGLAQAGDPLALFPLAAFLEQFQALEALQDIPFAAQRGSRAQTPML